eukprot:scaffold2771_cov252-Pinguiococcus_pyrenoidosus.AAC.32
MRRQHCVREVAHRHGHKKQLQDRQDGRKNEASAPQVPCIAHHDHARQEQDTSGEARPERIEKHGDHLREICRGRAIDDQAEERGAHQRVQQRLDGDILEHCGHSPLHRLVSMQETS